MLLIQMRKSPLFIFCLLTLGCAPQVNQAGSKPIVFEIRKNQEVVARAGASDLGVLNVVVDGLGPLGKDSVSKCNEQCQEPLLMLSAGGLTSRKDASKDEFLNWLQQQKLQVGDTIEIRIRDDIDPDPVKTRTPKSIALPKQHNSYKVPPGQ